MLHSRYKGGNMSSGMCYYRFAVPRQAYGKATASLDRALSEAVDLQLLYRPVQVEALINFRLSAVNTSCPHSPTSPKHRCPHTCESLRTPTALQNSSKDQVAQKIFVCIAFLSFFSVYESSQRRFGRRGRSRRAVARHHGYVPFVLDLHFGVGQLCVLLLPVPLG